MLHVSKVYSHIDMYEYFIMAAIKVCKWTGSPIEYDTKNI